MQKESGFDMADEAKLLAQIKKGEEREIDRAVGLYTPYLSTVLYNMASNLSKEDTEEIVSDVFFALWKNAEYIDLNKGTVRSYLAAAARNFALKRLKKKKDVLSLDEVDIPAEPADGLSEKAVWDAVMSLGEPDSEIFIRFYKYGERIRDISRATGINMSTVKTKLSRGKDKLKRILSDAEAML